MCNIIILKNNELLQDFIFQGQKNIVRKEQFAWIKQESLISLENFRICSAQWYAFLRKHIIPDY